MPENASCTLNRTVVDGNIKVKTGAMLHAVEVSVGGNIQAENAAAVTVNNYAQVGGSIQIKQGDSATVEQVKVNGDIQLESNRGALLVEANRVGGNIQVFQNIGLATIFDNIIDGNLQCNENSPAPIGGGMWLPVTKINASDSPVNRTHRQRQPRDRVGLNVGESSGHNKLQT